MKEDGLNYDQRMEELEKITYPKPEADFIYNTFNEYCSQHPYLNAENIRPKSIAREVYERHSSFADYIKSYKLEKSEAILLRHLSEVYKDTDSSLVDEWMALSEKNNDQ